MCCCLGAETSLTSGIGRLTLACIVDRLGLGRGGASMTEQLTGSAKGEGGVWQKFLEGQPRWIPNTCFAVASGLGVIIGVTINWWSIPVAVLLVLTLFFATGVARAHDSADKREIKAQEDAVKREKRLSDLLLAEAEATYRNQTIWLLRDQLTAAIWWVAEAVAEPEPRKRSRLNTAARTSILNCAVNIVGQSAQLGTRANLFRLHQIGDEWTMELEEGGFAGRGEKSRRTFKLGDTTMTATLANRARFEPDADDEDLPYRTYMTHPVSLGQDRIYGALTVDCLNTGELEKEVDAPRMAVLAGLLAITYQCEDDDEHGSPSVNEGKVASSPSDPDALWEWN